MIVPGNRVTKSDVAQHYDDLDPFYRQIWGDHLHHGIWVRSQRRRPKKDAVQALVHFVSQLSGIRKEDRVCDIGCGYGATAQLIAESYGAHVTGVTVSEKQFQQTKNRSSASGSLRFRLMDWLTNDFKGRQFHHAIAIESSEHMPDKKKFFSEAFRILKPGGRLVVCSWLSSPSPAPWQTRHLLVPICREGRLPGLASLPEYTRLMKQTGFESVSAHRLTPLVKRTWPESVVRTVRYFVANPGMVRHLSPRVLSSADFSRSLLRIWLAYEVGAMEYAIFRGKRPMV